MVNTKQVFGPLVSDELKLTAEEIEMGLIESNTTNAQLHIALLKVFNSNKLLSYKYNTSDSLCFIFFSSSHISELINK